MDILQLTANQFLRPMGAGRTRPILLGAEDAKGTPYEVVAKLRGPELSAKSQIAELVAAPLADLLGLDVPQAAVVDVPAGFEAIVPPTHAALVRGSAGLNFGSVHLGPSFTTWAVGRSPHGVLRDQAAAIFAFDMLVQNPDRRATNPNVWSRSDRLGVYDHEQAFSFLHLPVIGGPPRPWVLADRMGGFRFMEDHIFYPALRGARIDLGPFKSKLNGLSNQEIGSLVEPVPSEWCIGHDLPKAIVAYLREARDEATAFLDVVKQILQ